MHKFGKLAALAFAFAFAIVIAVPASASTHVHACRRPDGVVVYQDEPCGAGQRLVREWMASPDPIVRTRPTRARAREPGSRRRQGTAATRTDRRTASTDPCREAKERRDAIERRVGLARTYELLSALQRDVYDACR